MSLTSVTPVVNQPIIFELPEKLSDLYETVLIPFQRHVERIYKDLPWPDSMKNVLVETTVRGGKGDIAAAAKAISLMLRICPKEVVIDWMSMDVDCDPLAFLTPEETSRTHHRWYHFSPIDTAPVDFCLTGPVVGTEKNYIEKRAGRKIEGPLYGFKEIASGTMNPKWINYQRFEAVFSSEMEFPMGIVPGSGVFLDQSRIQIPLSRGYCDPSYLHSIRDVGLRRDILDSMGVYDDASTPDFDRYSFNSGYAHYSRSWGQFIDVVALNEKEKNVVILMNHHGEEGNPSAEQFCDGILTEERLELLRKSGYGSVTIKSEGIETSFLLSEDGHKLRNVTLILRPSFSPQDMKPLQLASERLLATGDNTAVEAWCAKCKLFRYEALPHKRAFLQQQIDLAKKIAPSLARLLEVDTASKSDLEKAAIDPDLEKDTLHFCNYIAEHCSFDPIFEGGIKRSAWQYVIPELLDIEEQTIDKTFQSDLVEYVKGRASKKSLTISTLPQLEQRVRKRVTDRIVVSSLPPLGKDPLDIIAEFTA